MEGQLTLKKSEPYSLNKIPQKDIQITIGEVRDAISQMIKEGTIEETSRVLWATKVYEGSSYERDYNVIPGTLLIGLEWMENGESESGTLKLEPRMITSKLN